MFCSWLIRPPKSNGVQAAASIQASNAATHRARDSIVAKRPVRRRFVDAGPNFTQRIHPTDLFEPFRIYFHPFCTLPKLTPPLRIRMSRTVDLAIGAAVGAVAALFVSKLLTKPEEPYVSVSGVCRIIVV